jgi:hypothetical protein
VQRPNPTFDWLHIGPDPPVPDYFLEARNTNRDDGNAEWRGIQRRVVESLQGARVDEVVVNPFTARQPADSYEATP